MPRTPNVRAFPLGHGRARPAVPRRQQRDAGRPGASGSLDRWRTRSSVPPRSRHRRTRSTTGSRPMGPSRRAASSSASLPGGRLAFLSHGRAVVKALSTAASRASLCSTLRTRAPEPAGASRWVTRIAPDGATTSIVGDDKRCRTEQCGAAEPGRHRVAVATKGHAGIVGDDPGDLGGGRERGRRESEQRLGVGQLADGGALAVRSTALALVTDGGAERVEGALGLLGCRRSHGAPPTSRDEADGGLDGSFAIAAPRRTGLDDGSVVLGHRSEGGLDLARPRHDHRRQAISPPHPRRPAQTRSTSSMASIRWAWSIFSASTPRTLPECGNVPNST